MNKQIYKDAERMLEKEIQEITQKGNISMDDLMIVAKVLDNLKDISIICSMAEESEYSERGSNDSYARRRDSMGRYSRDSYRGSYDDSYDDSYRGSSRNSYRGSYENGYSGHEDYDRMMADAKSEKERELIRQLKEMKR